MGNTSSTASQPGTPANGPITAGTPSASTSSAAPTSIPRSTSQPVHAPSSSVPTGTSSTFHSGLTPPAAPPSPAPPGTPLLLPHAGHFSPQNPHALSHPQAHDYSKSVVTKLILDGKLAPFYRGLEDYEEDWAEEDVARILEEVREKDYEEGVANSVTERIKEEREGTTGVTGTVAKKMGIHRARDAKEKEDREERDRRERKAYLGATECPICFLNYPPNINTSRCCQQPICTECFVQIKRSEPTITHLESESACCPFCMETDFGVIYERPIATPRTGLNSAMASQSALSISPEAGMSGFSHALSVGSCDADLNVGVGMAPKAQETMRRKSVSSKAKEVVTIDEIRPDWEQKLNSVKAAAARRASRRIVMRQVGDRLIPIGYTSSRAPGTADFSMSIPQQDENGSRRQRRGTRERDLEELMIMEAMRLSLLDHEEHQRKIADDRKKGKSGDTTPTNNGEPSTSSFSSRKRSDTGESRTSKFLNKLGGRSRSGSAASKLAGGEHRVSFASTSGGPSGTGTGNASPRPPPTPSNASSGNSVPSAPSPLPTSSASSPAPAPVPIAPSSQPSSTLASPGRSPPSSLNPPIPSPVAPVMTLADHTSIQDTRSGPSPAGPIPTTRVGGTSSNARATTMASTAIPPTSAPVSDSGVTSAAKAPGLPRLSLDMPALTPETPGVRRSIDRARASMDDNKARAQHVSTEAASGGYAQLADDE